LFYFKKKLFFLSLVGFFLFSCQSNPNQIKEEKFLEKEGLILINNTSVRIDPYYFSGKITQLKKGKKVKVVACSQTKSWIGNAHDFWYKIEFDNGLTGWVFGKTLKIISSKNKYKKADLLLASWEEKTKEMREALAGKWWSINKAGEFTNHCLEFSLKGQYKSYLKGQAEEKTFQGDYNFNFDKKLILFLEGTSFGNKLTFSSIGKTFSLKQGRLEFKKIK